jgi:hypothetical protein
VSGESVKAPNYIQLTALETKMMHAIQVLIGTQEIVVQRFLRQYGRGSLRNKRKRKKK